jgi:hypothetical protein
MKTFLVEFSTEVEVSVDSADTDKIIEEAKKAFRVKLKKHRMRDFRAIVIKETK